MQQSTFRILVVDDYEPWRGFVTSTLEKQPGLQVIGEASDGREAVEMAQQLHPDLILLDIGLPTMNGLEAGRQMRERSPATKILFLSENRSAAIAEKAFGIGASAYIVKSKAATELGTALRAVLRGNKFVSAGLVGYEGGNRSRECATGNACLTAGLPSENVEVRHEVEFYADDAALVAAFARRSEAVLHAENSVILIVTDSHRAGILEKLEAEGVDTSTATEQGRLVLVDAQDALSAMMLNDAPDPSRCAKLVDDLVSRASRSANGQQRRVAFCGECAPLLLAEGKEKAAIEVEHLWDVVTKRYLADTLCGYLRNARPDEAGNTVLQTICAEHTAVYGQDLSTV